MDRHRHGISAVTPRGERHCRAKLGSAMIAEARASEAQGWMRKDIAAKFGVAKGTITGALNGRTWRGPG